MAENYESNTDLRRAFWVQQRMRDRSYKVHTGLPEQTTVMTAVTAGEV